MGSVFAADAGDPSQAIAQADAATRAEFVKAVTAAKTVKEGLETYRQQQALQRRAADVQETLRQPATTCQTMAAQDALSVGHRQAREKIFAGQRRTLQPVASNSNTVAAVESAHRASNTRFCSEQEQAMKICTISSDPRYANLAGADSDAMVLFQSRSGSGSFAGGRDGPQVEAADAYIKRVVGGIPPEQLRATRSNAYISNPQARAYVELQRRYQAFLSMAAFSLNHIKESHNPLK